MNTGTAWISVPLRTCRTIGVARPLPSALASRLVSQLGHLQDGSGAEGEVCTVALGRRPTGSAVRRHEVDEFRAQRGGGHAWLLAPGTEALTLLRTIPTSACSTILVVDPVPPSVLIANPSPDVYGADLQMLESARALRSVGWQVSVALPYDGELAPRLRALGAEVTFVDFPVLRRANATPSGLITMALQALRALPRLLRAIRQVRPSVVYVNTVTLPWWILAARLARRPVLCHLHEAETGDRALVRRLLLAPLRLAHRVVVISRSVLEAMTETDQALAKRAVLIYNGVPEPPEGPKEAARRTPLRLLVVGRLSPRKAPHLALETVGRLRQRGYPVVLEVAGTPFEGYEWYEAELRARAEQPDLRGAVTFSGYRSPIWPTLAAADLVLAPSLREPFGNAVVEAQLALRPVVATNALGHTESIVPEETGLLVPPEDVDALVESVARLLDDPDLARRMAVRAREVARERFGADRYAREIQAVIGQLAGQRAVGLARG